MSSTSTQRSVRHIRRSVRRQALKEYVGGALWVLPTAAALIAIVLGLGISQIEAPPGSGLSRLAFQGTADDARALLISITSTVVTVIALVLGLTVVALQLSSTQFSPRLLRNFLRDRATQVVLSGFIATFVYSAAGLFTVGVEAGERTEDYPGSQSAVPSCCSSSVWDWWSTSPTTSCTRFRSMPSIAESRTTLAE
jgi:uncharacterized membrane protein